MVAIKVFFGSECRRSNNAPKSFPELKEFIYSLTGLPNPLIQYTDEEGDVISIYSNEEYQDLLSSNPLSIKITVKPSQIGQSSEFPPVRNDDCSSSDFLSTIEPSFHQIYSSESSNKPKIQDSGYSPQGFLPKNIENIPLLKSEIQLGPAEIHASCNPPKPKNQLLESIRGIIREEMGNTDCLKLSGINLKHEGAKCNGCSMNPIIGIRYKCSECPVNFCERCEYYQEHEHPFYKIKNLEAEEKKDLPEEKKNNEKILVLPKPQEPSLAAKIVKAKIEQAEKKNQNEEKKNEMNEKYKKNLENLTNMGFTSEQALTALIASNNNLEVAIEYLFNH